MDLKSDYVKIFILTTSINVISLFFINFNDISLFIYLNSLSLNLIMYNDIYFEKKHTHYHINFNFMPKYYPSNRRLFNFIYTNNIINIYCGLAYKCYNFWTNEFQDFETFNKSYEYNTELIFIIFITNILGLILLFGIVYNLTTYSLLIFDTIKTIKFNYINEQPLFYNINKETDYYYCWICEKNISKYKVVKKLNCPCQEYFHPDCIDKYLGLYNNYCRKGHRIAKYEHTV